ncbi:MAG: NAD(P)/FAD-dependent oxidoreductase, partial [Vicinamibacterales bacterium]
MTVSRTRHDALNPASLLPEGAAMAQLQWPRSMLNVVIIGAGVFGAWTAHHLLASGAGVTLVDAYGPANARASSGDESRIIRRGYGPDEIYSRWAHASLSQWRGVFDRAALPEAPLFHQCGVLWLAGDDAYTMATRATLARCGYPVEMLTRADLGARFPHLVTDDLSVGLFEPDGGVIMARRAVQALVAGVEAGGARHVRGEVAMPRLDSRLPGVRTTGGRELAGDAFVFACGPWLPKVFPRLLGGRIRPTRQV